MDNAENSQSEFDLDLSELDMDLPWLINPIDIKKISENFHAQHTSERYDAIEIKEKYEVSTSSGICWNYGVVVVTLGKSFSGYLVILRAQEIIELCY